MTLPRHWPTWIGIGLMRLLILLPYRLQMALGSLLGHLAWYLAPRERHVGQVNLALCLPDKSPAERERILRRHFELLGCALFETAIVWWSRPQRMRKRIKLEGLEHLQGVLQAGRGAIVLSAHFTCTEVGAVALVLNTPTAIMYQPPKNPVIARVALERRAALAVRAISSANVRELLKCLSQNLPVWYAPDQREHGRSGALVSFCGMQATTNVATSRLAEISGAPVLPYTIERLPHHGGYLARIGPVLDGFPSSDPIADATRFHALIEAQIRRCPEQYLWTYKRFKRPDFDPYQL